MKEIRFFYAPDVAADAELPADEAAHCLRVLRLQAGTIVIEGLFYKLILAAAVAQWDRRLDSLICFG